MGSILWLDWGALWPKNELSEPPWQSSLPPGTRMNAPTFSFWLAYRAAVGRRRITPRQLQTIFYDRWRQTATLASLCQTLSSNLTNKYQHEYNLSFKKRLHKLVHRTMQMHTKGSTDLDVPVTITPSDERRRWQSCSWKTQGGVLRVCALFRAVVVYMVHRCVSYSNATGPPKQSIFH